MLGPSAPRPLQIVIRDLCRSLFRGADVWCVYETWSSAPARACVCLCVWQRDTMIASDDSDVMAVEIGIPF